MTTHALLSSIRPKIRLVLAAPETDLLNITTEHVRTLLVERASVPRVWIQRCEKKGSIDDLIWEVFIEVLTEKEELDAENTKMVEGDLVAALAGVQLSKPEEDTEKSNMMEMLASALAQTRL